MPYLKSNWASTPPLEEFGRFAFGEIFTIPEMTLTRTDPTARACYLHGACVGLTRCARLLSACTPDDCCAGPSLPLLRLTHR